MLNRVSKFFQSLNTANKTEETPLSVEMACTVLLCEVMRADGHLDDAEQALLTLMISQQFSLQEDEVTSLISEAIVLSENAVDFHQFTSKINHFYTPFEKEEIVTLLWKLAAADGDIASIEEHIIRRIADLLHLSHAQYIRTKSSAQ